MLMEELWMTPTRRMTWIDVRDVAEALIVVAEKEKAGGERIIISQGPWKGQDLREYPSNFTCGGFT